MPDMQEIQIDFDGEVYTLTPELAADIKRHYLRAKQTPKSAQPGVAVGQQWMLLQLIQSAGIPILTNDEAMSIGARVALAD